MTNVKQGLERDNDPSLFFFWKMMGGGGGGLKTRGPFS